MILHLSFGGSIAYRSEWAAPPPVIWDVWSQGIARKSVVLKRYARSQEILSMLNHQFFMSMEWVVHYRERVVALTVMHYYLLMVTKIRSLSNFSI